MNENLKVRLRAAGIHFCCTVLVAILACALIFFVWFPGVLVTELGGFRLFFLIVGCDIVLGPLLTFVAFNRKKKKKLLILDLCIIVALQLAALTYGLSVVARSRPVYVVFIKDRLEIITLSEYDEDSYRNLTPQTEKFAEIPLFGGIRYASIKIPEDREQRQKMLFGSLTSGKDYSLFLEFYQDYRNAEQEIKDVIHPLEGIASLNPKATEEIGRFLSRTGYNPEDLGWLLVKHKYDFITAILDRNTAEVIEFLPFDPEPVYEIKHHDGAGTDTPALVGSEPLPEGEDSLNEDAQEDEERLLHSEVKSHS